MAKKNGSLKLKVAACKKCKKQPRLKLGLSLNKNRVLPSAMILDRLSIECIAKAATKEKIIESCCISSTKLVEQLVKSEPQYSKIVEKMADVYISLSQLLIALPIRDDDLNAAIKRKITRKLKHNPILIK